MTVERCRACFYIEPGIGQGTIVGQSVNVSHTEISQVPPRPRPSHGKLNQNPFYLALTWK